MTDLKEMKEENVSINEISNKDEEAREGGENLEAMEGGKIDENGRGKGAQEVIESSVDGPCSDNDMDNKEEPKDKAIKESGIDVKPIEKNEHKPVVETVEQITRRLRAERAAKEAAEAKLKQSPTSIKITAPAGGTVTSFMTNDAANNIEQYESETQQVELGAENFEAEEKRKLQSRGRFIGINRQISSAGSDKRIKSLRKTEAIDPPIPKPDVSSIVFNLSKNLKALGNNPINASTETFVPAIDPTNHGSISWNDLKLDISSNKVAASGKILTPNNIKTVVVEKEWKKGASDAANADISGDDLSENRAAELEDPELISNPEEETEQDLESGGHTWTESSTHAYFTPSGQINGGEDGNGYWTEDGYAVGYGGEWYNVCSEIECISRQLKLLMKIPEQMKKIQREVQETEKNVRTIMKNIAKDPEEGTGRVPEVNPARHTDRYVSIPPGTKVLVLTDSICSRMNGYKISSELKVCVRSYGGLTASEMATVITNIDEDVCYDVDYVFFHVGTNDLGAEEFPHVKSEFKHLIKRAMKSFSNATIFMSAILPRYGSTRELNDRRELNSLIASLAEKPGRLRFINASHHFVEREIDNTLRGDLYKRDYIHLTLKGMGVLANAFRQELDNFVIQTEGGSPCKSYTISASDMSECAATYSQTLASQPPFTTQNQVAYQSGYGDRHIKSPGVIAPFTSSAAASSGVHVTPPVPTVALAATSGAPVNPRQRISGRYTQYRR